MLESLQTPPAPSVTTEQAGQIAADLFGVAAVVAHPLPGERAQNFRLVAPGGDLVLRIAHPADSGPAAHSQSALLQHLERMAPQLPVPRLLPSRDGCAGSGTWHQPTVESALPRTAQLSTFLPGAALDGHSVDQRMCRHIGDLLGHLHQALEDFIPTAVAASPWDLSRFGELAPLVLDTPLGDPAVGDRLPGVLQHLDSHGLAVLVGLPHQTLHNDLNPHNLLACGGRITGVIDFGDLAYAPRLQDLAIAASYHIRSTPDPLAHVAAMVAGYHQRWIVTEEELHALWDLMVARLLSVLSISRWRARNDPSNATYLLRNAPRAAGALRVLLGIGCPKAGERLGQDLP